MSQTFADRLALLRAQTSDTPLERAAAPTLADLGVGWSVYEAMPPEGDYWPRGGVVLHVVPNGATDPETGEVVDRYLVVRADRGALHWVSLRADQLGALGDDNRPNAHTIRGVCQVAARELAARSRPDDDRSLELWSLGARLMAVLARPAAVAP